MKALLAGACLLAAVAGHAMRVDNFMLLDQDGKAHELYYYSDASAVVLIVQGNGCPIVRNALPDYRAVSDVYAERGVRFLMINSNLQDHRESIAAEAREWDIPYPILVDEAQLVGESLGLTRTAEVMVIDPRRWEMVYRGAVNDRLTYERQKEAASEHYLREALDAVLAGDAVAFEEGNASAAKGCLINLPGAEADHAQISYSDTVAPAPARQLPGMSPPRRDRTLGHDRLSDGARLRADDPRGPPHEAHAALACRPARRDVEERPRPDGGGTPDPGALGRGGRPARRRPGPAGRGRGRGARMAAGRAGSHRRDTAIRGGGLRDRRVPVPRGREPAGPGRLGAGHGDRSRRDRGRAPRARRHHRPRPGDEVLR